MGGVYHGTRGDHNREKLPPLQSRHPPLGARAEPLQQPLGKPGKAQEKPEKRPRNARQSGETRPGKTRQIQSPPMPTPPDRTTRPSHRDDSHGVGLGQGQGQGQGIQALGPLGAYAAPILRTLLSGTPLCLFVVDHAGNIVLQDGAGLRALSAAEQSRPGAPAPAVGRTLERLLGRALDETLQAHPLFLETLQRALRGDSTSGARGEQHGRHYDLWAQPIAIQDAGPDAPPGALLIAIDVTERIEAEQAARYQSLLLDQVAEGAPIVLSVFDPEARYRMVVGAGLRVMGLKPNQLKGARIEDVFTDATDAIARIHGALRGEQSTNTQAIGDTIWDNFFSPIYGTPEGAVEGTTPGPGDSPRPVIGALSISTDVTERVRAQQSLQERLQIIEEQNRAIRAMSAPIIEVWQGVLVVPIVGQLDTDRAGIMIESLLTAVSQRSAEYAILDFTAVEVIDTATADHVLRMVHALRLLGTQGLVSGIRPPVAQALVSLGVDLKSVLTVASLHAALRLCMRKITESRRLDEKAQQAAERASQEEAVGASPASGTSAASGAPATQRAVKTLTRAASKKPG